MPLNHVALTVLGRDRFRAAGVDEVEWQDDGRFIRVQVVDPDGYRVEVYAR